MLLLGIDLGSSSVKASVIDGESGNCMASAFYPKDEMKIIAKKQGWAEQDPETWWTNLKSAINDCTIQLGEKKKNIGEKRGRDFPLFFSIPLFSHLLCVSVLKNSV
jgi:xylulokinase